MRFGSVCSGIEAASVAFGSLGWQAAWFSEIEPFPCAVLEHHYPRVPNLGDMTLLPEAILTGVAEAPDVLCGGTPCQAFSVAGLRNSLDDARGNLSLVFCEIANAIDSVRADRAEPASIVFWENVPGVLSTKDNAFGCFLAGLAGEEDALVPPGGRWANAGVVLGPQRAVAWRVLDAQYFGLAQRHKRVFVVASARDGFDPAEVLLEFDGVRRDLAPSRDAGQDAPSRPLLSSNGGVDGRTVAFGGNNTSGPIDVAAAVNAKGGAGRMDFESETFVTHSLRADGFDGANGQAVAFNARQDPDHWVERTGPLDTDGSTQPALTRQMQVRRLTPRECERLQGFYDDYTAVPYRGKPAADGPRYKALGNSWAVPVVRWIGERIDTAVMLA